MNRVLYVCKITHHSYWKPLSSKMCIFRVQFSVACDINAWMGQNHLILNSDETEVVVFVTNQKDHLHCVCTDNIINTGY